MEHRSSKIVQNSSMFVCKFGLRGPFMIQKTPHAIGNYIFPLMWFRYRLQYGLRVSANLDFCSSIGPKPKQWFLLYTIAFIDQSIVEYDLNCEVLLGIKPEICFGEPFHTQIAKQVNCYGHNPIGSSVFFQNWLIYFLGLIDKTYLSFVYFIFLSFGFWYFGHFSFVIFFLVFSVLSSCHAKCKQRL